MTDEQNLEIDVRGRVIGYTPNSMTDHYNDGGQRSFDSTSLEILDPSRLRHRRLTIYHEVPVDENSPWRAVGAVLRFGIDEDLLNQDTQAFAAAARNLGVE